MYKLALALVCCFLAVSCCPVSTSCGDPPPRPGYAVSFEKINGIDRAILSVPDWTGLVAWTDEAVRWMDCARRVGEESPPPALTLDY
jgi:hypothetical protein